MEIFKSCGVSDGEEGEEEEEEDNIPEMDVVIT